LTLIRSRGVRARRIGSGHDRSRNALLKQMSHHTRTARLLAFARRGFDVAASHLSYTQAAAALRVGIPVFGTVDYEHRPPTVFRRARCFMVPSVLPPAALRLMGIPPEILRSYDGLKEDVYLADFRPEPGFREGLGVGARQRLVTFRPIADHAVYSDDSGDAVQRQLIEHLAAHDDVCVLVLPRTPRQRRDYQRLARRFPALRVADATSRSVADLGI
jgi:predicted glycosyltransferase